MRNKNDMSKNILHGYAFRICFCIIAFIFSSFIFLNAFAENKKKEGLPETQHVFSRYFDRVVKVQVLEKVSGTKAVIGSGFFVNVNGDVITNFHVIANLIHHPDRYRAEVINNKGISFPVSITSIDVINDLAVVRTGVRSDAFFDISKVSLKQGLRLYSLGFPLDIGISIVEGTYNGFLEHALYKKIHFTGSLNPGMSGGPAITSDGRVVGINVATAGEQVSFLVPVEKAVKLIEDAQYVKEKDFIKAIRSQLLEHQNNYFPDTLIRSGEKVQLGRYRLSSKPAQFFNCWGDSKQEEKDPYRIIEHQCSTEDNIYISSGQRSGVIRFHHRLITSDKMNSFQFSKLYSSFFNQSIAQDWKSKDEVTKFFCKTGNVKKEDMTFRTVFCLRGYKKLEGLYDAVFKAAVIGIRNEGIETNLYLSGVTFEKAVMLSRDYMEAITWAQ